MSQEDSENLSEEGDMRLQIRTINKDIVQVSDNTFAKQRLKIFIDILRCSLHKHVDFTRGYYRGAHLLRGNWPDDERINFCSITLSMGLQYPG